MELTDAAKKLTGVNWVISQDANGVAVITQAVEPNVVPVTPPTIQALQALIANDPTAYIAKRIAAYPPLTDLADALIDQANGIPQTFTTYVAKCNAVRALYPKPVVVTPGP